MGDFVFLAVDLITLCWTPFPELECFMQL